MAGMASLVTQATSALTALLYKTCSRGVPTLTTSTETWSGAATFVCMYEESSPSQQGTLDYSNGAGYGYDLWTLPTQAMTAGDRVTVDGMTLKVLEAPPVGAPGPLRRLRTQRIA